MEQRIALIWNERQCSAGFGSSKKILFRAILTWHLNCVPPLQKRGNLGRHVSIFQSMIKIGAVKKYLGSSWEHIIPPFSWENRCHFYLYNQNQMVVVGKDSMHADLASWGSAWWCSSHWCRKVAFPWTHCQCLGRTRWLEKGWPPLEFGDRMHVTSRCGKHTEHIWMPKILHEKGTSHQLPRVLL